MGHFHFASCQQAHRHSIFCVLPPHILHSVAQRGTAAQRRWALRTLATDQTFRSMRIAAAAAAGAPASRRRVKLTTEGAANRTIYTANNLQDLPGQAVRREGDPAGADAAVNEAYDGLGATFDFYWQLFERNSIDDEGMDLTASVHFGEEYNNAFWNGEQMVFGDGDGDIFNRFTVALDVIGHELTHGVTEDEARLMYFNQSGALNESISDVFGSMIKQRVLNQTADAADWLIGEGLFTPSVKGVALRSMMEPGTAYDDPLLGKDPQPKHMHDYVRTFSDNGGVHINSGIPNHAFYLAAIALGGHAWEKAGRIWYETLRAPQLRPNSGFRRFARITANTAARLYGANGMEQQAVVAAWNQVGIGIQ